MIVAGSASPLLLSSAGGYNLTKSLRFRSSASAFLNRTPASAGNQQKFTWSGWVKRGTLGTSTTIFGCYSSGTLLQTTYFDFRFNTDYLDANWGNGTWFTTTAVYRDPSAWYHIVLAVDTTQATASNRMILYVNGVQVTAFSYTSYPAQNTNLVVNTASGHTFGKAAFNSSAYLDGYLAEVNFIDGQALTPSSFGQTSPTTGVWQPKKYTGTYGNNGFYLPFTNTTSTSTLGNDFSGNNNTWTVNNISLTSGVTYDSMNDVPTLTNATTANYCTFNPLALGTNVTATNGNLTVQNTVSESNHRMAKTTFGLTTGKWYWELNVNNSANVDIVGLTTTVSSLGAVSGNAGDIGYGYNTSSGSYYAGTGWTTSGTPSAFPTSGVVNIAYDADAGKIWFGSNGTWFNSGNPATGSNPAATYSGTAYTFVPALSVYANTGSWNINCGQRPFAYTPPTGFVALNTFNLSTPTIGATASSQANKYFDATTYTGTGANLTITNSGAMQPDMLWIKSRSLGAGGNHMLVDSVRGVGSGTSTKEIYPNLTNAESSTGSVTSFNSNGFTLNGEAGAERFNFNGATYVGWQWRANGTPAVTNTAGSITSTVSANTTAGFSIVTYTGTGANATVGHGLGVAPSMIIVKNRGVTDVWLVQHTSLGPTKYIILNRTDAEGTLSTAWNNTAPTSSVFSIGTLVDVNRSSNNYVAYCFAQVAGYSAFGSYTGNGSSDGPFIFTGFRPKFVMFKGSSIASNWCILDSARNTYNLTDATLQANSSASELTNLSDVDFLSNGIKIRDVVTNDTNVSGQTYIYMAFAESPFKYANAR